MIPKSGKFVDREFHSALKERLQARQDLGEAVTTTLLLLLDFLIRVRLLLLLQ